LIFQSGFPLGSLGSLGARPGRKNFFKKLLTKLKTFAIIKLPNEREVIKMMTNVDYEGFNDWSDKELEEAIATIGMILDSRKKKRIGEALVKVQNAFKNLQDVADEIDYFDFNGRYSLTDIFESIKIYYTERMA
jgi:hypothetical protein